MEQIAGETMERTVEEITEQRILQRTEQGMEEAMEQKKSGTKREREFNLELLRIVSMVMIITMHFLGHGRVLEAAGIMSPQFVFGWLLEALSFASVNCYVLISGYFLCRSKITMKKLLLIICHVLVYSAGIYLGLVLTKQIEFDGYKFLYTLLPILTRQYWFATLYAGLYILSPILNKAIRGMTRQQMQISLVILASVFCILPNLVYFVDALSFGGGEGVVWFVVLYFTGAYFQLHYQPNYQMGRWIAAFFLIAGVLALSKLSLTMVYQWTAVRYYLEESGIFFRYNSILVYPASVALFLVFLNLRITNHRFKKFIAVFAPTTFGVYLIHDNQYLRKLLWDAVNAPSHMLEIWFIPYAAAVIVLIFLVGSLIDRITMRFIKNRWFNHLRAAISPH